MALWHWWRYQVERTTPQTDQKDLTYPEDKQEITKEAIKQELQDADDVIYKEFTLHGESVTIIYIKTMVEEALLQEHVLEPLQAKQYDDPRHALPLAGELQKDELPKLLKNLLSGFSILMFPERSLIIQINTNKIPQRSISRTETESTVLGPQDSLVESLNSNHSLIRRRIISTNLKIKTFVLGTEARVSVSILYMQNIANPENVERLIRRVRNVEYAGFVSLMEMKQMIEDKPYSPFPQFAVTSRPDTAVKSLLDGRVLVMMDGSPEAAIAPSSFLEMFTSPEDFYNRWSTATLLRFMRVMGMFVTILLTATYVSVLTYHPEMLPPALLTILSESRSKVPFPPLIEVLIIELVIEILREAGVRMPTKIGQTIGIVGGIVIGTASVEAGLASNILIVVVSVSALLSFLPPNFLMSNAIRFVRYGMILMAGILGIYGQMLALAFLLAHLLSLTSLGSPFLAPVILRQWTDIADSVIRMPMNYFMKRKGMSRAKNQSLRPTDEE